MSNMGDIIMCKKCHNGTYDGTIEQLNHDPELLRLQDFYIVFWIIWWSLLKLLISSLKRLLKDIIDRRGNNEEQK